MLNEENMKKLLEEKSKKEVSKSEEERLKDMYWFLASIGRSDEIVKAKENIDFARELLAEYEKISH